MERTREWMATGNESGPGYLALLTAKQGKNGLNELFSVLFQYEFDALIAKPCLTHVSKHNRKTPVNWQGNAGKVV